MLNLEIMKGDVTFMITLLWFGFSYRSFNNNHQVCICLVDLLTEMSLFPLGQNAELLLVDTLLCSDQLRRK